MDLHPQTGTDSDIGDFLVLLFLVGFGTALAVWLLVMPTADRQIIMDRSLNLLTLLLAQPGLYFSAWVATQQEKAWPERVALSLAIFLGFAVLLPVCVSTWLSPILKIY